MLQVVELVDNAKLLDHSILELKFFCLKPFNCAQQFT